MSGSSPAVGFGLGALVAFAVTGFDLGSYMIDMSRATKQTAFTYPARHLTFAWLDVLGFFSDHHKLVGKE